MSEHPVDPTSGKLVEEGDDVVGEVLPFRPRKAKGHEACAECGSDITINDTIAHITDMIKEEKVRALAIVVVTDEDQDVVLFEHGACVNSAGRVFLGMEILKKRVLDNMLEEEE